MKRRRPKKQQRGLALLVALVLIAVLTGATLALVNLAAGDIEIAAADRMGTVARNIAETGLDEVMTDSNVATTAPDPGDPVLNQPYAAVTRQEDALYTAEVRYVRMGPVEESSALQVQSVVYAAGVDGYYVRAAGGVPDSQARAYVAGEFYRVAPKATGIVSRPRHFE